LKNRLYQLLENPGCLWILLFVAGLLHFGTVLTGGFYADDYIQSALFLGNEALAEKGLLAGIEFGRLSSIFDQQFNFFDPQSDNYAALKSFGVLPWWTPPDALLHFFRPLATLTHALDYQLWPSNSHIMHLINVLWYLAGLLAIFTCFRTLQLPLALSHLALLLIVLDHSMFQVVTWIAARNMLMVIVLGFLCLRAYHLSLQSKKHYFLALLLLLLTLLSAEGAIVMCAYLGAYLFVLDERSWAKRIVHILPFALLVILWRLIYQAQGYGAFGVEFYLDPGREPVNFLSLASVKVWSNFFELFSAIDVMSGQIRPDIRQALAPVGAMLLGILCALLFYFERLQCLSKQSRFFLLAACFALVPGVAISLAPRVMIIPFIGLAVVLAELCLLPRNLNTLSLENNKIQPSKLSRLALKGINTYTCIIHIGLSIVLGTAALSSGVSSAIASFYDENPTPGFGQHRGGQEKIADIGVQDYADKHLVFVSSMKPFWLPFLAYEFAYKGQALPLTSRILSTNWYPVSVTRTAEQTLVLSSEPAFQFDPQMLREPNKQHDFHFIYLSQQLLGLLRASDTPWQQGQAFIFEEMTIRILGLSELAHSLGKPNKIQVDLHKPLSDYRFSYWDMQSDSYHIFALPEVGQSLEVEGVFSSKLGSQASSTKP